MSYKIMIFSSPGCKIVDKIMTRFRKIKIEYSVKISNLDNIGTIDISHLFSSIYNGFDGVIVVIRGIIKKGKFVSEFASFQKIIEEANRILEKKGFNSQRVNLIQWNGVDYKKLIRDFKSSFKKIRDCGPISIDKSIFLKKTMEATYKASKNFHYRSIFKAKEDILRHGKYAETELNNFLVSIFEAESERKYIMGELIGMGPLTLYEILEKFDFPDENIIRDIIYLKDQGYIEEITQDSALTQNKVYKYKVKELRDDFWENYFKPVSIIYDKNICCHCGLCSSICPFDAIELTENYLYHDESACITCGLCYSICPRSFSFENMMNYLKKSKYSLKYSEKFGYYKKIYSARTLIEKIKNIAQDGGIVSSLLYYLLDNKLVDAVVTIEHGKNFWKPEIEIIKNINDLNKTAGTIYAHSPVLSILDKTKKFENIAVVALPCMVKALTKAEFFPIKLPFLNNIKYKIGLFCMESFSYDKIFQAINEKFKVNIDDVIKMNIKKGRFIITLDSGEVLSIPLKEFYKYGSNYCHYCNDLTAELADISVGSIGSEIRWSSVITRSKKGEDIFNGALKQGLIEIKILAKSKSCKSMIEKMAEKKMKNCELIEMHAMLQY